MGSVSTFVLWCFSQDISYTDNHVNYVASKYCPDVFDVFFGSKMQLYPVLIQATEEAFSPQKRTPSTTTREISELISIFVGHF